MNRFRRRLHAWFAIAAMLFAAFAPAVSRAMTSGTDSLLIDVCSAGGVHYVQIPLAEAGHYPAIEIEASISRAMTELIPHAQYRKVQRFKQLLSAYQRNRDLVSVGAYVKGSDAMLDQAIDKYPSLEAFLRAEKEGGV